MSDFNEAIITYFGQQAKVNCDRKCEKAWGKHKRPKVMTGEYDERYKKDYELSIAPDDPGTYEGGEGKPSNPDMFPNQWCIRECERCNISKPGEANKRLKILSFN